MVGHSDFDRRKPIFVNIEGAAAVAKEKLHGRRFIDTSPFFSVRFFKIDVQLFIRTLYDWWTVRLFSVPDELEKRDLRFEATDESLFKKTSLVCRHK